MTFVDAGLISSPQDIENVIETAEVAADWNSGDALKLGQFVVCRSCTDTQLEFVSADQLPRVTRETSGNMACLLLALPLSPEGPAIHGDSRVSLCSFTYMFT